MKYLLCRPRGGINDTLCQIELCWRYAELYNRVLIVDAEYLVATGISVRFSKLFKTLNCNKNVIFDGSTTLLNNLNQLNTFPPSCKGRLNNYKTKLDQNLNHVDPDNDAKLSFDFNKDYLEDVLVHDQFGNCASGINCLARLKLTNIFRGDLLSCLSPLIGKTYIAIHIRHSDYQTEYKRAFEEIYEKTINQRLLICTDSVEVIRFANTFFDRSEVFTLSLPPDTGGVGLPTYATFHCDDMQRYDLIVKAFADLIGLATAKEVIFIRLSLGIFNDTTSEYSDFSHIFKKINTNQMVPVPANGFSGFSVLVDSLRKNPFVINQILTA
jgi:hypothetical protein